MAYKSVFLFSIRVLYAQSSEHLNKVSVGAIDSELEEKRSGPEIINFFLRSAEHEILNADKLKKNIKKFGCFSGLGRPRNLFFLLINVKMPTVVGISTFMSWKNFRLS